MERVCRWRRAARLTSHPGQESHPVISPDGSTLAFSASYEGPVEVYTMPLAGGLPRQRRWEADPSHATAWTPGGELVYATRAESTLPDVQLVALGGEPGERRVLPLSQASEGSFDASGRALYFVRPSFQRDEAIHRWDRPSHLALRRGRRGGSVPDAGLPGEKPLVAVWRVGSTSSATATV